MRLNNETSKQINAGEMVSALFFRTNGKNSSNLSLDNSENLNLVVRACMGKAVKFI